VEAEEELREEHMLSRADVLKRAAVVGAVVALPAVGTARVGEALAAPGAAGAGGATSVLSQDQVGVLEALVERIVPADATGPGGKEAGAAAYIENSLSGGLAGGLTAAAPLYQSGLNAVDAYATSKYGSSFTALSTEQQDAVLADVAAGKATGFTPDSATFFAALREHTVQGMFSDPVYGGNRNFAGWMLLQYPGVKMPVAAADQRVGVKVKPAHASTYANGQYPKAKKEALS
jgi:gluconate 2-dehydrogenase gamma chain